MNAVGGNNRTLDQIKKKIMNLRRETKNKAAGNKKAIGKTGGGE